MHLKGGTNVQWLVSHGGRAWAGMYTWNPHEQLSAQLKFNKQAVAYAKNIVNNPRGMLPTHLHAFERQDKLPICGFSWGDSHAWADMYTWNPHVQLSALLKRNKQVVAYTKGMANNPRGMFLPTHHACKVQKTSNV